MFYDFENQDTKTVKVDVWIERGQPIVYNGENGKETGKWKKLIGCPNMSIDTVVDPYSKKDFQKVTNNKKGLTVGDMWDKSAELSAKRVDKDGVDQVKEKYFTDYQKKTGNKRIPHAKRDAQKGAKDLVKKLGF